MVAELGRTLVVRADGHAAIGAGHVMRCLALVQAWQEAGGVARFAVAELDDALRHRLADEGVEVIDLDQVVGSPEDAAATARCARRAGAGWVVADGYGFGAAYQQAIKDAGFRLIVLDDYGHADRYPADIILNQNAHATPAMYTRRGPDTRLLLGTPYVLLRREFTRWAGPPRTIPDVAQRLLVTFGGSDPREMAALTIRALQQIEDPVLDAIVVAGGGPLQAKLLPLAEGGPHRVEVLGHVTDMPDRIARADLAVAAAGSTSWERAFLQLPSLVVSIADNQRPIAEALQQRGAAVDLGWWADVREDALAQAVRALCLDGPARRAQAAAAARLVDGAGGRRVVEAMARSSGVL